MELNKILFPAPKPSYTSDTYSGEMIWIPRLCDESLPSIPCLFLSCPRGSSKVMIYFHGNAEDIGMAYELMDHMRSTLLIHIIAVEYPGYGIYTGKTNAERVLDDCENVYHYLVNYIGISERNIILFGRSIGSGPAAWLASHKKPGALLLMSAYTSIKAVVKHIASSLFTFLVKERFNNLQLMHEVACPTFLVHGQKDTLIPFGDSERLHQACSGPCSLLLPKDMDHNEFDFFEDLTLPFAAFLNECGISVFAESIEMAFLNIPGSLFAPDDVASRKNYK